MVCMGLTTRLFFQYPAPDLPSLLVVSCPFVSFPRTLTILQSVDFSLASQHAQPHMLLLPIPSGLSLLINLFVPHRKNWRLAGSFSSWLYWCCTVKHALCYFEISLIHVSLYLFSQQMCWVVGGVSSLIYPASYPFKLPTYLGSFLERHLC